MLELRHITKSYSSGRRVLDDLSYTLAGGEFVAVMGDSGVGKIDAAEPDCGTECAGRRRGGARRGDDVGAG